MNNTKHEILGKVSKKLQNFLSTNKVEFNRQIKRYYHHLDSKTCRGTYIDWSIKINDNKWIWIGNKIEIKKHLNKIIDAERIDQIARDKIANRINKAIEGKVYLAPWDNKRIAWEDTSLAFTRYNNLTVFHEILDKACEGTGYFIDCINNVEGHICKI